MARQSNAHLLLINGLPPVSSVFHLFFKFLIFHVLIFVFTVLPSVFIVLLIDFPVDYY